MIYIGLILDFLINLFLPINSYFIIGNIDKNKIFYVIVVGIILDILFRRWFLYLGLLLSFYFILKIIKIKKRYRLGVNILVYVIFFNFTYLMFGYVGNYYLWDFIFGIGLQVIYLKVIKVLF